MSSDERRGSSPDSRDTQGRERPEPADTGTVSTSAAGAGQGGRMPTGEPENPADAEGTEDAEGTAGAGAEGFGAEVSGSEPVDGAPETGKPVPAGSCAPTEAAEAGESGGGPPDEAAPDTEPNVPEPDGSGPDDAEEAETAHPGTTRGARKPPPWLVWGGNAAALAALVVAVVFGGMWWSTASSDETEIARARDNVTAAVRDGVVAFTELDHKNPDAFLSATKKVATEKLRKQIERTEKQRREMISKAGTKVVSTIQDVAVSELNVHEGTAVALATVRNKVTQGEKERTKTLRLEVRMQRVGSGGEQVWKLSQIGEVPVGPGSR